MKRILKILFAVLFVGFLFAELIVMPIIDITNKDDRKTLNIVYAVNVLEIQHSINYIIPFGKDYYYIGFDEDDNAYLIHAPKKWAENNFADDSDNVIEITALQKKISDYDISKELYSIISSQEELTFPLGYSECLELTYIKDAVMKILSGILVLTLAVIGIVNYKRRSELPPIALKIYAVVVGLTMILTLVSIT